MNINWKVRIKNKTFWLSLIPTVLVLIQLVMRTFGVELDFGEDESETEAEAGTEWKDLRRISRSLSPAPGSLQDLRGGPRFIVPDPRDLLSDLQISAGDH